MTRKHIISASLAILTFHYATEACAIKIKPLTAEAIYESRPSVQIVKLPKTYNVGTNTKIHVLHTNWYWWPVWYAQGPTELSKPPQVPPFPSFAHRGTPSIENGVPTMKFQVTSDIPRPFVTQAKSIIVTLFDKDDNQVSNCTWDGKEFNCPDPK